MVKHDVLHALKAQILSQRSLSIRRYGRVVGNLTSGLLQSCPLSGNSRSVSVRLSLLLKGEHTGAFTPKWLAMIGTGRAGTLRAAEYGSSPIDPTTPAALEHCRAFLPFLPLRFEAD